MMDERAWERRLDALRERYHEQLLRRAKLEDENEALRERLRLTKELDGPGWAGRTSCNDGRIWARPEYEAREDCIRYFAGQAMAHAMASASSPKAMVAAARKAAFMLWAELESWLEPEREARRKRQATEAKMKIEKETSLFGDLADIADEAAEKLDDKLNDEPEGEGEK